jgi:serine/threonine-protein kinase
MKFLDGFLARRRVEALRSARSLGEAELGRLVDELVAMGPAVLRPLSECLAHGEARTPALQVLERLVSDETLDLYLELLASPDPTIVSGVSRVLRESRRFDSRRILAALHSPVLTRALVEPILRAHAGSIPAAEFVAALPGVPRDGQGVILRTLQHVSDPGVTTAVVPLLRHEDPWVRGSIARFLGEHPGPGAVPALAVLLRDTVRTVRFEAVKALHALGAREAVPDLLSALEDADLQVQSAAIDALRVLADVSAVPGLVAVLANESEHVRRAAVEVLNEVATPEAIQDLVRALRDHDWWVRVRAADALGTLGGERVVTAVVGLMQDKDDSIRRHAVEILNAIPDPAALPSLVAALDDTDWWVRERAIDALGKTRDERAIDPLLAQLARGDSTAVLCVRALGAIGHPRILRDLGALVDSPLAEVRREAQEVLLEFPRGELSSDDRAFLNETLSRAQLSTTPSSAIRGTGTGASGSLLAPLPLAGTSGALPARSLHLPLAPQAREGGSLPPALRREAAPTLGLNFADLPEGQELLERYRIVRRIGRGGFGTVYLAHDAVIQEDIILKMLNPQLALDDAAARRFVQELKLARRISHRNVIRIHDFIDLGGTRAISMEYFPGKDLGRLLAEGGPIDPRRVLRIAAQVCDGLAAAHHEGVVHRDIKPGNILVGDDDETRLVDFGLASAQQATSEVPRLTQSGLLIGTPEYMAPEQITGDATDHRVDLYSLGVVLYEALSGRKPFTAETPVKVLFQHLEGGATPLRQWIPDLPEAVEELVAHAMARDADGRPASALLLRAAIERTVVAVEVGG